MVHMNNLLYALLLCPFLATAQTNNVGINFGVSLSVPAMTGIYKNVPPTERGHNIAPSLGINYVRGTKNKLFYGVQLGYTSLKTVHDLNYAYGYNRPGIKSIVNYGKASFQISAMGGNLFEMKRNSIMAGLSFGAVANINPNPNYRMQYLEDSTLTVYNINNNTGWVAGAVFTYTHYLAKRVGIGFTVSPKFYRLYEKYKITTNGNGYTQTTEGYNKWSFWGIPVSVAINIRI